jgi:hypothetical protein
MIIDTRGAPKFMVRYRYRRLMELAPDGWMLSIESDERFEKVYVAKLERLGVKRISDLLQAMSNEEGGKPLVLLCFEDVFEGEVCHRSTFASWWYEETGQPVVELGRGCGRTHNLQERLF